MFIIKLSQFYFYLNICVNTYFARGNVHLFIINACRPSVTQDYIQIIQSSLITCQVPFSLNYTLTMYIRIRIKKNNFVTCMFHYSYSIITIPMLQGYYVCTVLQILCKPDKLQVQDPNTYILIIQSNISAYTKKYHNKRVIRLKMLLVKRSVNII